MGLRRALGISLCGVLAAPALWGVSEPVTVSPGSATGEVIEDRCPTFSWGGVAGARSYELVVYRVGEGGEEARRVLGQRLAGSASGWTPSLDRCLERGERYAWSVRALGVRQDAKWSAPSLFEVASGPSDAEFELAIEVVKSYLAVERDRAESVSTSRQSTAVEEQERPPTGGALGTMRAAPAVTQLSVDGNIDATSFTGDGSKLTGVENPDGPCFDDEHRFVNCGNGTVTDTVTGLIYLRNANCFGLQNWVTANQSAAGLADGACGLSDGSRPGDWRLQTKEEWEGILDSSCTTQPEIVGNQSPTPGCYTDVSDPDSEWASGVESSIYWSSTTASLGTLDPAPRALTADLNVGGLPSGSKTDSNYVWPVRGGQ